MAVRYREDGEWKLLRPGLFCRTSGEWRNIRYLFEAVETTTSGGPGVDDPIVYTTIWRAHPFEAPGVAPPTPILTELPRGTGFDDPVDAQIYAGFHDPSPIGRSWSREFWYTIDGYPPVLGHRSNNPEMVQYVEFLENLPIEGSGTLTVRARYINEIGPGPWSGLSNTITVREGFPVVP